MMLQRQKKQALDPCQAVAAFAYATLYFAAIFVHLSKRYHHGSTQQIKIPAGIRVEMELGH